MSHRLKLNAVHFANSLEDEKSLLDTSTEVLESKLLQTTFRGLKLTDCRKSSWYEGIEKEFV
jgi:hypothetical protein